MKIAFHGAARTVTGSKHLIHINPGKKILLDCGMYQGMGKETLTLNKEWGFDPAELDYVIISHAHIDHIGLLPKLVKEGYNKKIFCTPPTADLARIMLLDSAHIQEEDVKYINKQHKKDDRDLIEPLYTVEDAEAVFPLFHAVEYNQPFKIDDEIELMYVDCGHILGSAAVHLKLKEHGKETRLTFSGDVGRYNDMLLKKPDPFPQSDFIIMESTYGDRLHDDALPATDKLLQHIQHTCIEKKGKLVIPAFSVGRTQEILYMLNRLEEENRLPKLRYIVDSPLSTQATEIIKHHPECFNKEVQELLKKDNDVFAFEGLHFTNSVDESIQLNDTKEPVVIISASGMAEAGRVKHHIAHAISSPANTILLVGYCEPESLGGRLKSGATHVGIFGVQYDVKAEVQSINSLSAHGDYQDLIHWLSGQEPIQVRKLFLVHGEYDVQIKFKDRLIKKGFRDVEIPARHQEIGLGDLS